MKLLAEPEENAEVRNEIEVKYRHGFTRREFELMTEIQNGLTNQQIAQKLQISDQTVKNHITAMLRKANEFSRTGLALASLRKERSRLLRTLRECLSYTAHREACGINYKELGVRRGCTCGLSEIEKELEVINNIRKEQAS